ncbi:1-acyl-sn-glycerol-3-phosphate acyltransferase [Pseudomonas psychrotolerans]|nr:1-acyl-sn-glycerol-3-phosphate acyltransferase [Pseudomonas psychrotolerans]
MGTGLSLHEEIQQGTTRPATGTQGRGPDHHPASPCEKFRRQPVTIVNYLEGTRFTPAKHAEQGSPYRHLLKPKAGGMAFVLAAMGDQLDTLLDITLVYPEGRIPGFWDLLCGRVKRVIIDIRARPLDPARWAGDYSEDAQFRAHFQQWVSELWAEKDQRIEALQQSR